MALPLLLLSGSYTQTGWRRAGPNFILSHEIKTPFARKPDHLATSYWRGKEMLCTLVGVVVPLCSQENKDFLRSNASAKLCCYELKLLT